MVSDDGQEYRLNPPFRENLQKALCASDKTPWQVCLVLHSTCTRLMIVTNISCLGAVCVERQVTSPQVRRINLVSRQAVLVLLWCLAVVLARTAGERRSFIVAVIGARMSCVRLMLCCWRCLLCLRVLWLPCLVLCVCEGCFLVSLGDVCQPVLSVGRVCDVLYCFTFSLCLCRAFLLSRGTYLFQRTGARRPWPRSSGRCTRSGKVWSVCAARSSRTTKQPLAIIDPCVT